MAKEVLKRDTLDEIFKATHSLLKFPQKKMWIDYPEDYLDRTTSHKLA